MSRKKRKKPSKIIRAAEKVLAEGSPKLPSPEEIEKARILYGFTAYTLATWGIRWPPYKGWRRDLEQRYRDSHGIR